MPARKNRLKTIAPVVIILFFVLAGLTYTQLAAETTPREILRLFQEKRTGIQKPVITTKHPSSDDPILKLLGADSLFCVRINNLDNTLAATDQYLAGLSPLSISMMVRAHIANLLADPMLSGVNIKGSFALFAISLPGTYARPDFMAILVPITDYDEFITANPNCSKPDADGISTISAQNSPLGNLLAIPSPDKNFAIVTNIADKTQLLAAKKILTDKKTSLADLLEHEQKKQATDASVWAYANVAQSYDIFAPTPMETADQTNGQTIEPETKKPFGLDKETIKQIKSITLTVTPTADVLNLGMTMTASKDSELAKQFTRDTFGNTSAIENECWHNLIELLKQTSQKYPPDSRKAAIAYIPNAADADLVVAFGIIQLAKDMTKTQTQNLPPAQQTMMESILGQTDIQTQTCAAMAWTAGDDRLSHQLAIGKQHLIETITAIQQAQQQTMMQMTTPESQDLLSAQQPAVKEPVLKPSKRFRPKSIMDFIGTSAPDIKMKDIDGNRIILSELKSKRVVLDFWATWCPPCRQEIPELIKLRKAISPDQLVIIGISNEPVEVLRAFAAKNNINYPLVSDNGRLPQPYRSIRVLPTKFFIDKNGLIRNILKGAYSFETLKANALGEKH